MSSGNSAASGGGGSGGGSHDEGPSPADFENEALSNYLYIICGAVAAAVILWKVLDTATKYARTVVCLNNDRQRYFAIPSPNLALIKRHILYAPVFSKRHNREIQLSSAINVGTLPTRFQLLFLTAYFATNVAFSVIDIPFAGSYEDAARILRNRTGVLAVVNMVRPPTCTRAGLNRL